VILASLGDWFPFLVYALLALAIPLSLLAMSFLFATRPKRRSRALKMPFESGVSQGPPPQQRFTISFYLTALLFIVFDIEVVFLFPVAVVLREVGFFALGAFLLYLGVLIIAFIYEWKKGGLEWK
jgi:NADH-quinone oxidoreductase subunit A